MNIARMRIPVFVSCPSVLNAKQEARAEIIHGLAKKYGLEWRGLGRSDYPNRLPLREVLRMIRHCSGGIILGFEQYHVTSAVYRRGCGRGRRQLINKPLAFPTPWNHLEAGILFNQGLPILIFVEKGISGGVFDPGITDVYVHKMPSPTMSPKDRGDLDMVFQNWEAEVRRHYYHEWLPPDTDRNIIGHAECSSE